MSQSDQGAAAPQDITPYHAVQMLLHKALEQIALAKASVASGDADARAQAIEASVTILGVLQDSLDLDQGGEIAANLDALYDYMNRLLSAAANDDSVQSLQEAEHLLAQIQQAWDAIEPANEPVTA